VTDLADLAGATVTAYLVFIQVDSFSEENSMMITPAPFRISAIPTEILDRIRAAGKDDFCNPLEEFVDEEGGSALRCCLQPSAPGDRLTLIAHRPFSRPGPYAEIGPVLIHAERCAGYSEPSRYPAGYRDWATMIFRPYHEDGRIAHPAIAMVEGPGAEQAIDEIFADPTIEMIHSRNVYAGCYMFAIHRPSPEQEVS